MKKFAEFTKNVLTDDYGGILHAVITFKRPTGLFLSQSEQHAVAIVTNLKNAGINLQHIIVIDKSILPQNIIRGGVELGVDFIDLIDIPKDTKGIQYVFSPEFDLATPGLLDIMMQNNIRLIELQDSQRNNFFRQMFLEHLTEIYDVYKALDKSGREIYEAYWRGKISGRMEAYRYASHEQYLLAGFLPVPGDVLIDGGAFDGMTAREFALMGSKVYAFELDGKNYEKCRIMAEKSGFTAENMGLSDKKSTIKYSSNGASSYINDNGQETIGLIDIDTYAFEKNLQRVDFIKLDVEGAEMEALRGGAATISKFKPKLAICLYHKLEDLWQIPLYIKELRSDYEFSLRHYANDVRANANPKFKDLLETKGVSPFYKTMWELVLYAK
ncbi:MAG: FkbM family methyltransferase [Selenomonadaceae bacterium]|nr:FkbM family methyltransferase [Selenomonadaceae bacterium]